MNIYLEEISKQIKNKSARKAVLTELESHIEEKKGFYIEIGYSEADAEAKAIEEMGTPDETAVSLNALHSEKWYKIPVNIFAVLFYIFVTAYCSSSAHYYGDPYYSRMHTVLGDLVSTLILLVLAVILIIAYKRRNKFLAFSVPVYILFMFLLGILSQALMNAFFYSDSSTLLLDLSINLRFWYMLFTPFFYFFITMFTKGFPYYCKSVLSNETFDMDIRYIYTTFSVIVFSILFVIGLLTVLSIMRKERMLTGKKYSKLIMIFLKAFSVFVCLNLIAVSGLAVFSYLTISYDEAETIRLSMLNCVTDLSKNGAADKKYILEELKSSGFSTEKVEEADSITYNFRNYNTSVTYVEFDDYNVGGLVYLADVNSLINVAKKSELTVPRDIFIDYKVGSLKLDDYMKSDTFGKAYSASYENGLLYLFYYTAEGTQFELCFKNNVLNDKYELDENNQFIEEPEAMSEPLPSETLPMIFN